MTRSHLRRWLGAFTLVVLGCGSPDEDARPQGAALRGSAPSPDTSFGVSVVRREGRTSTICSGTLLAPNLVLTARHCVTAGLHPSIDCDTETFGKVLDPREHWVDTSPQAAKREGIGTPAVEILVSDRSKFCGNDLALLILQKSLAVPTAGPVLDLAPLAGSLRSLTAIGFGETSQDGSAGERRIVRHASILCLQAPGFPCEPATRGNEAEDVSLESAICAGDSGGGLFVPDSVSRSPMLVAVASRGHCEPGRIAKATRVDAHRSWIMAGARRAAALGHYDPPAWAR